MIPNLASKKECTGCLACVDSCSIGALSKVLNEEGHFYYKFNQEVCIQCGKCMKSCPVVSKLGYSQSGTGTFYAVWATDKNMRVKSASGGCFAAMAQYVLDNRGVVFGAVNTSVCDINHIFIESEQELHRLQGSKYTSSDASGCYKQAFSFLQAGRLVLFSGTGCQVAGLLAFLNKKRYSGKLITIDLVCGGIPSRLLIQKFIDNEPYKVNEILSFRTKDNGWKSSGFLYNMKVMDDKGEVHDYAGVRNLIIDGFCSELTNRYSCYNCRFNGTKRLSDYTMGDLWGDEKYPTEHREGLSLLIAHSDRAISLLDSMNEYLATNVITSSKVLKYNPRIFNGRSYKKYMPERVYMNFLFRNVGYCTLKKIYAYAFPLYSPWIVYKAYRFLLTKLFG